MREKIKSVLSFDNYIVESVEFQTNLQYIKKGKVEVDFDLRRSVRYDKETKEGQVYATTTLFNEPEQNNYPFYMQIKVVGFFKVEAEEDTAMNLLNKNAVAILFPYIRALISTYTSNANVQPLILPPINVSKLVED